MSMFNIVVQAAALSVLSNILAQVIDAYQKNVLHKVACVRQFVADYSSRPP
jgi:hypothetical protein